MMTTRFATFAFLMVLPLAACAGQDDDSADNSAAVTAAPEVAEQGPAENGSAETRRAQTDDADAAAPEGDFRAGQDYAEVEPAQPTENPGKIEVMEIFWYGCPHCYDFEPPLQEWVDNKPDDVAFLRLPAVLNRQWEVHARAYYTAEALGVLDDIHKPLFEALHEHNRNLGDDDAVAAFFAEHGVSAETYLSTARSFAVENKMRRAAILPRRYGITGVPAVIVNGKYRIDARMAQSWDHFIDTIEYLVRKERASKGGDAEARAPSAGSSG